MEIKNYDIEDEAAQIAFFFFFQSFDQLVLAELSYGGGNGNLKKFQELR